MPRRIFEADDDAFDERGVIKDGRSIRVPLLFADGQPAMLDYRAHSLDEIREHGCRVKQAAYDEAVRADAEAWRRGPNPETDADRQRAHDEALAAVLADAQGNPKKAAYLQAEFEDTNAWRWRPR